MRELHSLGTQLRAKLCASCADHPNAVSHTLVGATANRNSFLRSPSHSKLGSVSIRHPFACVRDQTNTNKRILVITRSLNDFSVMPRKSYLRWIRIQSLFHSSSPSLCPSVVRLYEFMNSNQMNAALELFMKLCMESLDSIDDIEAISQNECFGASICFLIGNDKCHHKNCAMHK